MTTTKTSLRDLTWEGTFALWGGTSIEDLALGGVNICGCVEVGEGSGYSYHKPTCAFNRPLSASENVLEAHDPDWVGLEPAQSDPVPLVGRNQRVYVGGTNFNPKDDKQKDAEKGFSWSLSPFSLIFRALKLPVIGFVDLSVTKSKQVTFAVVSLIYHALPVLARTRLARLLGVKLVRAEFARRVARPSGLSQCPDCSCVTAPANEKKPAWAYCICELRAMLARPPPKGVSWDDPPNRAGPPIAFRLTKDPETLADHLVHVGVLSSGGFDCPHGSIKDDQPRSEHGDLVAMSDGFSLIRPAERWRSNLRTGKLRCTQCYQGELHGLHPKMVNAMRVNQWSRVGPLGKTGLLWTILIWKKFLLSLPPGDYELIAVTPHRVSAFDRPLGSMPVVILIQSDRTKELILARHPNRASRYHFFKAPMVGAERGHAGLRYILATATIGKGHNFLIGNQDLTPRMAIDLKVLAGARVPFSSMCTGHVWPFFMGNAFIAESSSIASMMHALASLYFFGPIYGWDEVYPALHEKPVVLTAGYDLAPGILMPIFDPTINYDETIFICKLEGFRLPSSYYSIRINRESVGIVAKTTGTVWDDSARTFWHALSDPRPIDTSMEGPGELYLEGHWDDQILRNRARLATTLSGENIAQEISATLGGFVFFTYGTRGDRVPVVALAKHLSKTGVFVTVVHLNTPDEGVMILHGAEGEGPDQIGLFSRATSVIKQYSRCVRIVPMQLAQPGCVVYSIRPPPDIVRGFSATTNLLLNLAFAIMGWERDIDFNIGAYARPGWLPRSADGNTFLQHQLNTGEIEIGAYWGSGGLPAPGYEKVPVITETDHVKALRRYKKVVCPGNAGFVQTAAASGCQVVTTDTRLDRNYREPNDAGAGVTCGSDPDNIYLALSRHEPSMLGIWLRKNMLKPWKLLAWFGVERLGIGIFRLIMLYLIYAREQRQSIVSTDPLTTLFLVVFRTRPTFWTYAGLYVAAKISDSILEFYNKSYYWVLVRFLSMNIRMAVSPIAMYMAQRYNVATGLMWVEIAERSRPLIDAAIGVLMNSFMGLNWNTDEDVVFMEYSFRSQYGTPIIHTDLVCPARNKRYGGTATYNDTYTFELRDGGIESPFLIPTNLRYKDLEDAPHIVGRYGAAWNCQTGLLLTFQDRLDLLGWGLFGIGLTSAVASLVLGSFAGILTIFVAITNTLPTSVGLITVKSGRETALFNVMHNLYQKINTNKGQEGIAILEWWRSLAMPFSAPRDHLTQLVRETVDEFRALPILYRGCPQQISRLDRAMDEMVALGAARAVTDIIKSDLFAINTSGTEENAEYISALKTLKDDLLSDDAVESLRQSWSDDAATAVITRYISRAPEETIRELIAFDDLRAFAWAQAGPPLSNEDLGLLVERWREFKQESAELADTPAYLDEFAKLHVNNFSDLVPALNVIANLNSTPDARLPLRVEIYNLSEMLRRNLYLGLQKFILIVDRDQEYNVWWSRTSIMITREAPKLLSHFSAIWPPMTPEVLFEIPPGFQPVIEVAGEIMAAVQHLSQSDFVVDQILPSLVYGLLSREVIHDEPIDLPLRKWLWKCFAAGSATNFTLPEAISNWLIAVKRFCEERHIPAKLFGSLSNLITTMAVATYDLLDKLFELFILVLTRVFNSTFDTLNEYFYLGRAFASALLPEHRRRPKAVWALLFASDFTRLTPAERFLLSCKKMEEPKPVTQYRDWAETRLAELNQIQSKVHLEFEWPWRALNLPREPLVVDEEMARLAPLMPSTVRTDKAISEWIKRWRDKGVPPGMDGSWFATPERAARSIQRYDVERPRIDDHIRSIVLQTAHALADKYPEMYLDSMYLTPEAALRKIKVKYSPGLPFIPRFRDRKELRDHGLLHACAQVAEKRLLEGVHPGTVAHAFVKMDVVKLQGLLAGKNIRQVVAQELIGNVLAFTSTVETTRRQPPLDAWVINAMPRSEGGIRPFYDVLRTRKHVLQADAHEFDSKVAPVITVDGLAELRSLGYKDRVYSDLVTSQIRANYIAMRDCRIVSVQTGEEFAHTGGMMTGQANTSVDNRDSFRIMIIAGWSAVTGKAPSEFWELNDLGNAGDDDAIGTDESVELWDEVFLWIQNNFGTVVEREREGFWDLDLIGLQPIQVPESSTYRYNVRGIPVPEYSVRSEPMKMMMKRTEFRTRIASLRDVSFYLKHVDGLIGTAFLTCHQPEIYKDIADEYERETCYVLNRFFEKVTISKSYDKDGNMISIQLQPHIERPRYVGKTKHIRAWLKNHRFPDYEKIFDAWVKPQEIEKTTMRKKHTQLLSWNPQISGVDRFLYGLITTRELLYAWIPNHVARSLPEFSGEDITYIMRNQDYTIAKFVWLSLFHKGNKRVPSSNQFRTALRENPYGSAEDPIGFLAWLANKDNLFELVNEDLESYRGKMITVTVFYYFIETIFKGLSQIPGLGILIQLFTLTTRDVNRLYAALNYIYMLSTGRSSPIISNLMPADPFAWIKQFSVIGANCFPLSWHRYPGARHVVGILPKLVELWAGADILRAPPVIRRIYNEIPLPTMWGDLVEQLRLPLSNEPLTNCLVVAPTGTGKSTAFVAAIFKLLRYTGTIWLLCPTIVSRNAYENQFLPDNFFQILEKSVENKHEVRLKILTYGHFLNRNQTEVEPGDIVLFDEMHLCQVEMLTAWHYVTRAHKIQITATPNPRYQPSTQYRLTYPGGRRFNNVVTYTRLDFASLWQKLTAESPEKLTRAVIIVPTIRKVHQIIQTLGRLSVPAYELSSDIPEAHPTGVLVATSIIDTAITIQPPPTIGIDFGQSLVVNQIVTTNKWPSYTYDVVQTSPTVHTQRCGRFGRSGAGEIICLGQGGFGPEQEVLPSAYELLQFDDASGYLLSTYGIQCPLEKEAERLDFLGYLSVNPSFEISSSNASNLALCYFIFSRCSSKIPLEVVENEFLNLQFHPSEHENINILIENIRDHGFGDPLAGIFADAVDLLQQGLICVTMGELDFPCCCLVVDDGYILPCGVPRTLILERVRNVAGTLVIQRPRAREWLTLDNFRKYARGEAISNTPIYGAMPQFVAFDPNEKDPNINTIFFSAIWGTLLGVMDYALRGDNYNLPRIIEAHLDDDMPQQVTSTRLHILMSKTVSHHTRVINLFGFNFGEKVLPVCLVFIVAALLPDPWKLVWGAIPDDLLPYVRKLNYGFTTDTKREWVLIRPGFARVHANNLLAYLYAGAPSVGLQRIPRSVLVGELERVPQLPNEIYFRCRDGHFEAAL